MPPDPERRLRNRSVRAARVRATLHMLHTHGPSRSPQTVPINAEAADQTRWSAAYAYARRREKRLCLVAGVHDHRAPSGLNPERYRCSRDFPYAAARALHYPMSGSHVEVPRNTVWLYLPFRPSGWQPDVTAGRGPCTLQSPTRCATQYRRFQVGVPGNSRHPLSRSVERRQT